MLGIQNNSNKTEIDIALLDSHPQHELYSFNADELNTLANSIAELGVEDKQALPPDERLRPAILANKDTVAWLTVDGTTIDGPVQQYEGCLYGR
jgi:hypothetical protein